MTFHPGTRGVALISAAMLLGACSTSTAGPVGHLSSVSSTASGGSSPTTPAHYFANGKVYQAWIIAVLPDGRVTIGLVHHLVDSPTDKAATNYLTSHGQTVSPDGVPDDYIDVDTHVHKTEQLSDSAAITTNMDGTGPKSMDKTAFMAWLATNVATPMSPADIATYLGAPTFIGPLFSVTFTDDTIVSADQIFEP